MEDLEIRVLMWSNCYFEKSFSDLLEMELQWGDQRQEDQFGGCCSAVKDNCQDADQGSKEEKKGASELNGGTSDKTTGMGIWGQGSYSKLRKKSLWSSHLVIFIFTIHKLMTRRSGEEVYGLTSLNGHNVWRYMYLTWRLIKRQLHQRRTLITRGTKWPHLWTSIILFSLESLC